MDDVTVYQCPECNFNADNLDELDSHITENHSNENHLHTATPSKTAAANIAVKQQQSVTALIANEVPTRAVSERVDHKQPPQQQQHSPKSSSSSSAASRHNQPVEDDEEDEHRYDDDEEDFFNERNATTIKQSNSFREDAQNRFNHIQEDDNYEDGDQMLEDEEDFFQPQQQQHHQHQQQQKPNNQFTANNGVKPLNSAGIKAQAQQQPFASRSQPANRSSLGGIAAVGASLGVLNSDNHYERQYACKQCEFFTNNPRSILYHRKEFHREKINVHECQYCQYASQYSGKVERHTMLRHKIDIANGGTIAPAASSQNNATLVDESAVGDDDTPVDDSPATLAAVAAANVAKFQCNKCPCKYKRSSDLSKHMRLKHGILSSRYSNAYPELAEQNNRNGVNNQSQNGYGDEIENDENDEELYGENNGNSSVTGTPNGHHHNAHHQTNLTSSANRNVMGSGGIASNNRNFNQLNQKKIVVQSVASPSSSSTSQQQPKPNSQPNSQPIPRRIAPSAMASASSSSSSSANPYQLQCPYCTYTANLSGAGANDAKADYLVHVKDHLCGKAFRCVLCNSVYKYRGDCVVHLKRKHQKADMIAHSYVDKFNLDLLDASEIYSLLKPKQQDEPENEEKLFGCAYCDYKANYKGDVYKHQTRRHPGTMKQVNVLAMHHSFNGANQSLNGSNVLANCSNQSSANNSANNSFNHGINDDLSKYSGNGKFYSNNNRFYNGNSKGQNGGANRGVAAYQEEYYNEDEENMIGGEEDEMIDYENENGGGGEGEKMMEDEDEINYEGEENFVEGEEAAAPLDDQDEVDEDEEDFFNERQQLQQQQQLMGVNNGADMMSRYQCKFCAFVAKSHAKLKLHLATHYNLKRYMCPICKRRANFKWDIQKHLRKIHNDFTSEVICLSEIEARKSIDTYMETTNANGGRMVNNLNNGQTDAQSDHSSTTTTTTTTTIGANGNMLINEGKSATAALRAPNSNGSSVNYASSSASSIASQQQQQQQRAQYHQQSNANFSMSPSQFGSPNNANSAAFMGSDTTGNKKFRCTICPYRSNWKADLYRHLRKRHGMQQPGIDDVIVLSADEAANTLEEYERIYGVNVRKRARFDAIAAAAAAAATGSTINPGDEPVGANENFEANECKRMRTTDSSSVISTSTSGSHSSKAAFEPKYMNNGVPQENYMEEEDDYNQADQMENNHLQQHHQQLSAKPEETAANGGVERLPVSIAELNIKPYKCLKCGFRSDRKSDTLRHIRVKHELEPLHAFKFLRIMSIKEASETIEEYESTRLFRKSTSRVVSRDYNLINSLVVSQATAQSPVGLNRSSSSNMAQNHMSPKRMSLPTVPQQNLPPIKTTTTKTAPLVSLDYFRCPICLFKHRSRLVMKKHLANHYHSNEINSNPIYQCNLCGFKAGWQFTVKKHIITSHVANPNAAVVRIEPPKKRPIKKNRRRLQRLMMLTSNGATKPSNGEVVNNGEEEYYETHENEDPNNINGEQIESHPQVVTKTELNESNGGEVYHNNANMSYTAGDINNEVGARKVESIILTDYEGVQFEATYLVSNGPGTGSGGSSLNYSLNGGASVKKKMFYCETCPYKTNNYCNLKQHLLQHRFRDGFFKCRYCPYFVSMIRLLKQHEVLHEEYVPREGPITKPLPSNVVPSLPILQHRPIAASSVYSFPK